MPEVLCLLPKFFKPALNMGEASHWCRDRTRATGSFQFPKVEILIMKTKLLRSALLGPRLPGEELLDAKKWGWKAYDSGGARARLGIPGS